MPQKATIHRVNGETAEMDAIDARYAVKAHPDEWSMHPFPADQQAKAKSLGAPLFRRSSADDMGQSA